MDARAARSILSKLNAPGAIVAAAAMCVGAFSTSLWPGVVWKFSNLTSDGSPLELTFSTHDDEFRFACEAAPPEMPATQRVEAAALLCARLGAPPISMQTLHEWQSMQSSGRLRWGAWISVRSHGDGIRTKIYVETPIEARSSALAQANRPIIEDGRLKMIGYDCFTRVHEYYYRQPQMNEEGMRTFRRFLDGTRQRQSILDAFARLCALPKHIALQWVNFGYSLAGDGNDPRGFALFVRDRSTGSRSRIRACFLESQTAFNRTRSAYGSLFATVPDGGLPDHEIVSVIARASEPPELRVGISAMAMPALVRA